MQSNSYILSINIPDSLIIKANEIFQSFFIYYKNKQPKEAQKHRNLLKVLFDTTVEQLFAQIAPKKQYQNNETTLRYCNNFISHEEVHNSKILQALINTLQVKNSPLTNTDYTSDGDDLLNHILNNLIPLYWELAHVSSDPKSKEELLRTLKNYEVLKCQ